MTPGQRKELYASTSLFLIILFAIAIISPTGCLHTRPQPRCLSGHTEIREAEEVFICDKFEELDAGVGKGCKIAICLLLVRLVLLFYSLFLLQRLVLQTYRK